MDRTLLSCEDLWVGYRVKSARGLPRPGKRFWAIKGLNLSVSAGEMVGIVGTNGCGKTTLLRTVAGVFPPSKGRLDVRGKIGALVELRPDSDRDLSVRERMTMSAVLLGFKRRDSGRLDELVSAFGELDAAVLDSPVYTLSTGMLLRLEMSILLHAGCDILAVDELLMAGDTDFKARCLDRIGAICQEGGAALLSSHDPSLLSGCNRVLRLEDGRFVDVEASSPPGASEEALDDPIRAVDAELALVADPEPQIEEALWSPASGPRRT